MPARRRVAKLAPFIVALVSATWSCGSTPDVSGEWAGRVPPNHLDNVQLRLTQDGKVIRGTACWSFGTGPGPNGVRWRDGTVSGSYPTIKVVGPGFFFQGEFEDGRTITGNYNIGASGTYMNLARVTEPGVSCF